MSSPPADAPHLTAANAYLAPSLARRAWEAGRFTFEDWHGRRVVFRLDAKLAGNGGFWYASTYEPGRGTVNVYAGAHRPGRRATRPACLTVAGLLGVSQDLARRLGTAPPARPTYDGPPDGRCPTCGRGGGGADLG